jgi:hypothetical protein
MNNNSRVLKMIGNVGKMYNYIRLTMTTKEIEIKLAEMVQDISENVPFDGSFDIRNVAIKELYQQVKYAQKLASKTA